MSYVKPAGFREARYGEFAFIGRAYAHEWDLGRYQAMTPDMTGIPHRLLFSQGGVVSGSAYPDDCGPMPHPAYPVGPTAQDMHQLLGVPVTLGKPSGAEYASAVKFGREVMFEKINGVDCPILTSELARKLEERVARRNLGPTDIYIDPPSADPRYIGQTLSTFASMPSWPRRAWGRFKSWWKS